MRGWLTWRVALIVLRTEGGHECRALGRERRMCVLLGECGVVGEQLLFYCLEARHVVFLVRGCRGVVLRKRQRTIYLLQRRTAASAHNLPVDGPVRVVSTKHVLCAPNKHDGSIPREHGHPPPPALRLFFGTRSSAARFAMLFIRACDAALLRSVSAAFRLLRSLILSMIASCSLRSFAAQLVRSRSRSSDSRFSSAARSSRSRSFSRLARSRASYPAFKSFCFFFSFTPSSSSCTGGQRARRVSSAVRTHLVVRHVYQGE